MSSEKKSKLEVCMPHAAARHCWALTPLAQRPHARIARSVSHVRAFDASLRRFQGARMTDLLQKAEKACEVMSVFVREVYQEMCKDAKIAKSKKDMSKFTIADGLVQYMVRVLLTDAKFGKFCGEESASYQVKTRPYMVDELKVPNFLADAFDKALAVIRQLETEIEASRYGDVDIFVDPIDGTREFCNGNGEQCTICIGFSKGGAPIAGIVFRPLTRTYAAGCKAEKYFDARLDKAQSEPPLSVLTSNSSISRFVQAFLDDTKAVRIRSGGAGNKMLMLLEGKGTSYIQDRGVSRWDTCAAQAVLEAYGGALCKLTDVIAKRELKSYKYLVDESTNSDLNPAALLTKYNARDKSKLGNSGEKVTVSQESVGPYCNLCGLYAVATMDAALQKTLMDGLQNVASKVDPSYS